jgi:hypothetical protein
VDAVKLLIPVIAGASLMVSSAVIAQTTTAPPPADNKAAPGSSAAPSTPSAAPTTGTSTAGAPTMTEEQAKSWIDKAVYSSDDKNLGDVAAIKRDPSGKVTEVHADIGGFLGIGSSRVRLMPSDFKLQGDRMVLNVTAEQAKSLPKVEASGSGSDAGQKKKTQ